MRKEAEAKFMLFGIVVLFIAVLGLTYVGNPPVQRFIDKKWEAVSGKVRTTWADFEKVVDTPSVAESIAMERVRIKKACNNDNNQQACQYLKAIEAEKRR